MYAGHFAAALALKAQVPRAPTWGLLVGVGVLDILFGPFVLAGIERVSLTPGISPGFSLDHIDWSHSLVMSVVWSILFGAAFLRRGRRVAAVMAVAVFSHFVLDIVMHPPDLALWPGSAAHLGFGLWRTLPLGWWFVELGGGRSRLLVLLASFTGRPFVWWSRLGGGGRHPCPAPTQFPMTLGDVIGRGLATRCARTDSGRGQLR